MPALTVVSPIDGRELGSVPDSTPDDVDKACRRAQEAFRSGWPRDGAARARFLSEWASRIEAKSADIARLITAETGKVVRESERELLMTTEALRFNSSLARLVSGTSHQLSDGSVGHVMRQPVGVAGFIVPWNWPVFLLFRDMAPALAAGVTAVVKPAPQTPLSLQAVLDTMPDAGAAVVQSVPGGAEAGSALVEHPAVRVVCFTGSTAVGRTVAQAAASRFIPSILELGGKGTSVICGDADLPAALDACRQSAFLTSGQMCMANSRLIVERSLFDETVERLRATLGALVVGDPTDAATDMGPLISPSHAARVSGFVDIARGAGQLVYGGGRRQGPGFHEGHLRPALVAAERVDERISTEEVFGPLVSVEAFDDLDEAVARANATRYGLSAAVWTSDISRAWTVARELDFGTVWVNRYNRTFAEVPSGGMKASGSGRSRGFEGLHEFTEVKHVNWEVTS